MDSNTRTLSTFVVTAVLTICVVAVTMKWANSQYWQNRPANDVIVVEQPTEAPTVARGEVE